MIKNLLSNLPGLSHLGEDVENLSDEEIENQAKAERITFHRSKVRNGLVKFAAPTNGQLRRAQVRAAKAKQRKQLGKARRNHWQGRQEAATLRAYLQGAGILPYATGTKPSDETINRSYAWLFARFGELPTTGDAIEPSIVETAIQAAWARYSELMGLPLVPLERA